MEVTRQYLRTWYPPCPRRLITPGPAHSPAVGQGVLSRMFIFLLVPLFPERINLSFFLSPLFNVYTTVVASEQSQQLVSLSCSPSAHHTPATLLSKVLDHTFPTLLLLPATPDGHETLSGTRFDTY